jgi:predicted metalloenzyme YecM
MLKEELLKKADCISTVDVNGREISIFQLEESLVVGS